jgi:DNA-binding MarR family transcriptional regulator
MNHSSAGSGDHPDGALDAADLRERLYAILRQLDRATGQVSMLSEAPTANRIASILKARRLRGYFFDPDLFADPAWDMLLDLYAAELNQIRVATGSLSTAAGVPATTALRWMNVLEKRGLFKRYRDQLDGRRVFVSLTLHAKEAMDAFFKACPGDESLL